MPRPLQSLDLVFREEAASRAESRARAGAREAAIVDGRLLAESGFRCVARARLRDEPAVVVEPEAGQIYVVAANGQARKFGIAPGSKLNAALALAASLRVLERSPRIERAHLESLAAWAQTLTSTVSIEPPETLLLEVSGSIKLFA